MEKLRISKPADPAPPVAIITIAQSKWCTVDGEQDWKCHATPHSAYNHHHPEISKKEIAVLDINNTSKITYQSRFVDDVRIRGFEKGHNPSKLCGRKGFRPFSNGQLSTSRSDEVLFGDCSKKRSRFIDSLVLVSELENHNVSAFPSREKGVHVTYQKKSSKESKEN